MNGPGDILPRAAERFGPKIALVTPARRMTFGELNAASDAVASGLRRDGAVTGERIAICAANRWEWIVAYHGILKAGAVVTPLNALLTDEEVAFATGDSGARTLFCDGARAASLTKSGAADGLRVISFDAAPAGGSAFESLVERAPDAGAERFVPDPLDVYTIGYTSGTTGRQKGAMQSHRAVLLNCALTATMHARSDRDTVVTALPAPHVYGNVAINGTLLAGGTVVLMPRFNAAAALELIAEHRATLFEGVPTMYAQLLASSEISGAQLGSLTRSTVGGQTIACALIDEWEGRTRAPLLELWGMTELSGLGTTHAFWAPNVHGSAGVALPGVALRIASIAHPETNAPSGEAGELCVRGPLTMIGYFGQPAATAEAVDARGWLHTGDIASMRDSGHIFIVDRLKDTIITGGYNVYPAEIERVVSTHPAVAMVGVGRIPDDVKGELAVAYVVLRPHAMVTESELIAHCRQSLAPYKLPRAVRFVADLPKTSSGKIRRNALTALEVSIAR